MYNACMKKGDVKLNAIYNFLKEFSALNGFSPSVREIGAKFGIKSTSTVHYYLEKLKQSGVIQQEENKKRAVVINGNNRTGANFVPLVGNVSAGKGILAQENIEEEIPLPQSMFTEKDLYLLRVEGQSMINAGIDDGDFVVVRQQNEVDLGEIAVVLWQEKATIKRIAQISPNLVLHPENDSMEDIVITPDESPSIIGKVVGCLKKF